MFVPKRVAMVLLEATLLSRFDGQSVERRPGVEVTLQVTTPIKLMEGKTVPKLTQWVEVMAVSASLPLPLTVVSTLRTRSAKPLALLGDEDTPVTESAGHL